MTGVSSSDTFKKGRREAKTYRSQTADIILAVDHFLEAPAHFYSKDREHFPVTHTLPLACSSDGASSQVSSSS